MRFALFAIVAPMLAAPALARPPIAARQVADPCAGIGADAVDTLPGTFTLATLNTTLPNANTTGAPLTLGQDGVTTGAAAYSFSTYASWPYLQFSSLTLTDGGIRASGEDRLVAVQPTSVGKPSFLFTTPAPTPAPIYCAAPPLNPGGLRRLAINGHTDLFQLCFGGRHTDIYYNVTTAGCYQVEIQIIEA